MFAINRVLLFEISKQFVQFRAWFVCNRLELYNLFFTIFVYSISFSRTMYVSKRFKELEIIIFTPHFLDVENKFQGV